MSNTSPLVLLTPAEAAQALRSNPRTLERWRTAGGGPTYIKIGRRVGYRPQDLDAWLDRQARRHTHDGPQAA